MIQDIKFLFISIRYDKFNHIDPDVFLAFLWASWSKMSSLSTCPTLFIVGIRIFPIIRNSLTGRVISLPIPPLLEVFISFFRISKSSRFPESIMFPLFLMRKRIVISMGSEFFAFFFPVEMLRTFQLNRDLSISFIFERDFRESFLN